MSEIYLTLVWIKRRVNIVETLTKGVQVPYYSTIYVVSH